MSDRISFEMSAPSPAPAHVDLYWIPLGAGGWFVRRNGRLVEAVTAWRQHRRPLDLYHSALEVRVPEGSFVIEQAPVPDADGDGRGVVASGPVGLRAAGRMRLFRYEVRRWRDGRIPDAGEAVESPRRLTIDLATARRLLDLVPRVPTATWGRDELRTGEMWNSNAIVAWLLTAAGVDAAGVATPRGGRAPGWDAGIQVARRAAACSEAPSVGRTSTSRAARSLRTLER